MSKATKPVETFGHKVVAMLALVIGVCLAVKYWVWPLFVSVLPVLGILVGVGGLFCVVVALVRRRRRPRI